MLQVGQRYRQPDNDYCGTITNLRTIKQEFGTYQLIYYLVDCDKTPTCDVYRLSDAGDVLLGFVTPLTINHWTYHLYPEEEWDLKLDVTLDMGINRLLKLSERQLEEHFNELFEVKQ